LIRFFHVAKRYPGGQLALDDVSFEIPRGQFVFLTGASGAGKTTLLKLVFREEAPSDGQILVNGRNVTSIPRGKIPYLRRSIGVVFQNFRLIPRKTVFENVTFLPRVLGVEPKGRRELAYQALRRVGLAHRFGAFPQQLSGGEQQRVAIARAIIAEPELLLADEPTGNLDPDLSREILRLFLEINRRGTTVLLATHDRSTIERVGGRVLTLDAGRLVGDRTVEGTAPLELEAPGGDGAMPGDAEGDATPHLRASEAAGVTEAAPGGAAGGGQPPSDPAPSAEPEAGP
jgi:cell division transport system ATP-binding protein